MFGKNGHIFYVEPYKAKKVPKNKTSVFRDSINLPISKNQHLKTN